MKNILSLVILKINYLVLLSDQEKGDIMFIQYLHNGKQSYGILEEDKVQVIEGDIFNEYKVSDEVISLSDVQLLPPCNPSKVVCVGLNYKDHAAEVNLELPKEPLLFLKPNTSVIAIDEDVIYPEQSKQVDYEAELAIVIGKKAKNVTESEAKEVIFGYTCANDVTARDIQFGDGQWTRGKSFDTFCPIGPGIVKTINEENAKIELLVNGEVKQSSNINQLIFPVDHLVSYVSSVMTLLPGDVILTGTPHGIGPVQVGDEMTVTIEGIGELTNKIKTITNKEAVVI